MLIKVKNAIALFVMAWDEFMSMFFYRCYSRLCYNIAKAKLNRQLLGKRVNTSLQLSLLPIAPLWHISRGVARIN